MTRSKASAWLRGLAAEGVQRGWRWLVAAGAIVPGTPAARRFARFGAGSFIAFPAGTLFGQAWIAIGADTLIAQHVTLSAGMLPGLDLGPRPVLTIGDRCTVGRGSHIVGHQSIAIGDDVFTGPYVYITDQNHSYDDPDAPIGRQWPHNEAVRIGSGCWLGVGAIVLPGSTLGRNVVVAGGAVVRGRFGDHCVLAGVPARVVRRHVPGVGWVKVSGEVPADLADAADAALRRSAARDGRPPGRN